MMWTKDVPTVPGWYWARGVRYFDQPEVCLLLDRGTGLQVEMRGWETYERLDNPRYFRGVEWCGPLPAPTEAT